MTATTEKRGVKTADAALVGSDGELVLQGARCERGDYSTLAEAYRCPRCFGAMQAETFAPVGRVWSFTTIALPSKSRDGGYTLAYVDLEGGPRILCDIAEDSLNALTVGAVVRIQIGGDYLLATVANNAKDRIQEGKQ